MIRDPNIGRLTLSLKEGRAVRVQTPDGDVWFTIVKSNGAQAYSIQVIAPKDFQITREADPVSDGE